jgi:gamma-glutamyltranspeptidase/glutathione hydrolase
MIPARLFTALAGFTLLAACSFDPQQTLDDINSSIGLPSVSAPAKTGLVVGDEPFAVRAGAAALKEGGTAADAATAMYFALSVTFPVAAGLGGGGLCIAHDTRSGITREFDFLPRNGGAGGAYAVPGNVKGFEALQTTFGKLPWRRVIAPAESLAASGFPISRALSARLNAAKDSVRLDADLAAAFLEESGDLKNAGQIVFNRGLAETLGAIRLGGANGFYGGATASAIASYAAAQGGGISVDDLRGYRIGLSSPRAVRLGSYLAMLPQSGVGAGAFSGTMIDNMNKAVAADANLETATTSAVKAALTDFGVTALPTDLGSTGFAVADANGQAVACAVTMNGALGAGRTVPGTGIVLAGAPTGGQSGLASAFLTPAIAADGGGNIALSGAAAGGPNATAAITLALFRLGSGNSMTRPSDMRSTGAAPYEMVNAIVCQNGTCAALPDPGGSGVGLATDALN